jgi:hypothetical protein
MAGRLDQRQRKEMLDQWKAQQRAAARAKLPLPDDQLQALFEMLEAELFRHGCNHSLRLVRQWLQERRLPVERVEEWLRNNGGYCDCEAVINARQAWREATHDVDWGYGRA